MSTDAIGHEIGHDDGQDGLDSDQVREIGHDEFDPVGTLTLLALYFLVLVGMWIFTYFVEFAGRGPTVIG